jgi:hypothetical protein
MNSLNDCHVKATRCQQMRNCTALTEWIDAEAHFGSEIEIFLHPQIAFNQLIEHGVIVRIRFVSHHPSSSHNLQSSLTHKLFENCFLLVCRLLPPQIKEAYFRPNKLHRFVFHQLFHNQVENFFRIAFKIAGKRLQPTCELILVV